MKYEFSLFDLFPYLLLYGVGIFLAIKKIKNFNSAYGIFFIMLIFSSIRYGIGYDYYAYRSLVVNEHPEWKYESIELFALFLVRVGKALNSSEIYFAIYSILTLFPVYFVSKKLSICPSLSLLIYLLYPSFYIQSLDVIRNSLAFSLVFLAYYYLQRNKYIYYVIFNVIATQFHISACIGILLFLIRFLPNNRYFYLFLILFSAFAGTIISQLTIFNSLPGISVYLSYATPVGSMRYLMIILVLLNFFTWDKVKNNIACINYLKCESIGLCFFFLFMIDDTLSFRLSVYFLLFMILAIPYQLRTFKISYKQARFVLILLLSSIVVFQWYLVISNYIRTGERMSMIPYQTIFYNIDYSNYVY